MVAEGRRRLTDLDVSLERNVVADDVGEQVWARGTFLTCHDPIQVLDQPLDIGAPAGGAEVDAIPAGEQTDVVGQNFRLRHCGILHVTGIFCCNAARISARTRSPHCPAVGGASCL